MFYLFIDMYGGISDFTFSQNHIDFLPEEEAAQSFNQTLYASVCMCLSLLLFSDKLVVFLSQNILTFQKMTEFFYSITS